MKKILASSALVLMMLAFMPAAKETSSKEMETAILTGFTDPVENGLIVPYGVFLSDSGNKLYVRGNSPFPRRIAVTYNKIKRESWHGVAIKTDVVTWYPARVPR